MTYIFLVLFCFLKCINVHVRLAIGVRRKITLPSRGAPFNNDASIVKEELPEGDA